LDGSALDDAWAAQLTRLEGRNDIRRFSVDSAVSWIVMKAKEGSALPALAGAEEQVYLLMRPASLRPPRIFWTSKPGEQFGAPRMTNLRQELTVVKGGLVGRELDGFIVYSAPLERGNADRWPGVEGVHLVRLDPSFDEGTFEIAFFGIARRAPRDEAP
jgi:hypothetical protein